jgi:tRNA-splicing endonuclease subunit Sen34
LEEIEWIYPTNCDLKRRKTFAKLWTNGFFITDGTKFGGDFLAYPGDPIQFHAKYIVICCEKNPENMSQNDLVAKSRMGTGVKKIPLLAFMAGGAKNEQVKFKAIKWTEKLL